MSDTPFTETKSIVGIWNVDKIWMDDAEDFVKMLDEWRDIIVNQLPEMPVNQIIFMIDKDGWKCVVPNPEVPQDEMPDTDVVVKH